MRRINSKYYEVWESTGKDEYGQPADPIFLEKRVECNIALSSQVVVDNIVYISSLYTGLTWNKDLKIGQELRHEKERYRIQQINPYSRQTQLVLEKL